MNQPTMLAIAVAGALGLGCGATTAPASPPAAPAPVDPAIARERSWSAAFEAGVAAYKKGDKAAATARFEEARGIWPDRPDAAYNLAILAVEAGDGGRAAAMYRETIERLDASEASAAPRTAELRKATRDGAIAGLLAAGGLQYEAGHHESAAEIYQALLALYPHNRDGLYNLALTLVRLGRFAEVGAAADAVIAIDPLNKNIRIVKYNANQSMSEAAAKAKDKGTEKEQKRLARAGFAEVDAMPIYIEKIAIEGASGQQTLRGEVVGNTSRPGTPFKLAFRLLAPVATPESARGGDFVYSGEIATVTVELLAPKKGERVPFAQALPAGPRATSYGYRVE